MKKILSISLLSFAFAGVAMAAGSYSYPTTFSLKVGESANITNYQNMKIELVKVSEVNTGGCPPGADSRCLGGPTLADGEARLGATLVFSTEGGCGPDADSRCLGAPAFMGTNVVIAGQLLKIMGLGIKVTNVTQTGITLNVIASTEGESRNDDNSPHPLPPVPVPTTGVLPIGRDFGNRGNSTDDGVTVGGQGSAKVMDKIIICPNGEAGENCSVCSKGDCRPETMPAAPSKSNSPVFELRGDETFVSAVKVDASASSSSAYVVRAKRKARLFFLFPVNPELTYSVSASGSTTVSAKPWWNFLAW